MHIKVAFKRKEKPWVMLFKHKIKKHGGLDGNRIWGLMNWWSTVKVINSKQPNNNQSIIELFFEINKWYGKLSFFSSFQKGFHFLLFLFLISLFIFHRFSFFFFFFSFFFCWKTIITFDKTKILLKQKLIYTPINQNMILSNPNSQ